MRVLDGDKTGRREHHVPGRLDGGEKLRRREQAFGSDRGELHAGIRGARARFVPHHVSLMAEDHIIARAREKLEPDLVRHGAARHEERALLAEHCGEAFLQEIDARVFAILVVADGGLRHGAAHGLGGARDGIGTQVDKIHHPVS